jgi:2-dehydro-3-deoxygluconokinase
MVPLMEYVDICIGNEEDAENCLGYKPNSDITSGKTDASGYKDIFVRMKNDFNFKIVASTLRESFSASHNGWKALLYDGETFYESKRYDIEPIVDRVGAGDSFSGGLIHGLLTYEDKQTALEFAVAASAIKHTIPGDFNHATMEEVITLMNEDGSGRVVR